MAKIHSLAELCVFLKLDIWTRGEVANMGIVSVEKYIYNFSTDTKRYWTQKYAKGQWGNGLYLNDWVLLEKNNRMNTYVAVVAVCDKIFEYKKKIYFLKIQSTVELDKRMIEKNEPPRRRKLFSYRKRSSGMRYDGSSVNAALRR